MLHTSEFALKSWIIFVMSFIVLSLIDRFLISKNSEKLKNNIYSTFFWFICAIICVLILKILPTNDSQLKDHSLDFLVGYLIELSLSVDNVFVFIMIFEKLKISEHKQHIILRIGIISAIIMRLIMILFAIDLIQRFQFIFYIFGATLFFSAMHMLIQIFKKPVQEKDPIYKKYFVQCNFDKFFTKVNGKTFPTINLLALILIEKTDILFAIDSIPAVISVTQDSFVIFTSNILAIAGLRALFFCVSHSAENYPYLKHGIIMILLFIGVKLMLVPQGLHMPNSLSLGFIVSVLTISIVASNYVKKNSKRISSF